MADFDMSKPLLAKPLLVFFETRMAGRNDPFAQLVANRVRQITDQRSSLT